MFNEFPYTNYEKINLDWLLDLGNKLKADAESGAFDGERGPGIFGITSIYVGGEVGGPGYYCYKFGDVGVGDFVIGYGSAAGDNTLYLMKITSVSGNYLEGTTLLQITGPTGPRGETGPAGAVADGSITVAKLDSNLKETIADVDNLKSAMNQTIGVIAISPNGYYKTDGKTLITSNRRMHNTYPIVMAPFEQITISAPYSFLWYAFDRDMNLLSSAADWVRKLSAQSLPAGCFYINLSIKNSTTPSVDISGELDTVMKSINVALVYDAQNKSLRECFYPLGGTLNVEMEQGGFNADGTPQEAITATRLRSKNFIPVAYLYNLIAEATANTDGTYQVLPIYYADNDDTSTEISRESSFVNFPAKLIVPYENAKFVKLYVKKSTNATIVPSDLTIRCSCPQSEIKILNYAPAISQTKLFGKKQRVNDQDIAVYNGHIFDFGEGVVSVDGAANLTITNGHGNNCCFGDELHGDFPYLYCAPWNNAENCIYVNQYENGAMTLVRTIRYETLAYLLNACVDEANNRAYIFNCVSSSAVGQINFVVADLDGNVLSTKAIGNIPYVEGITFYDGTIIVASGHGVSAPNYIHVFDTEGNLLSKTRAININWFSMDTLEGIDIDKVTGDLYIGTTKLIVKS